MADVRFGTACSDLVVISQIDIKHQLFSEWLESCRFAEGLAVPGIASILGTDLETGWIEAEDVLAEPVK